MLNNTLACTPNSCVCKFGLVLYTAAIISCPRPTSTSTAPQPNTSLNTSTTTTTTTSASNGQQSTTTTADLSTALQTSSTSLGPSTSSQPNPTTVDQQITHTFEKSPSVGPALGGSLALVIVVLVAILAFTFVRRRHRQFRASGEVVMLATLNSSNEVSSAKDLAKVVAMVSSAPP